MYDESIVIYSDILFLINFSLDYLSLFITGRLLHRGARMRRLLLGALIGGAYSFVPYLFSPPPYISLPMDTAFAAIICLAAFGFGSWKSFGTATLTFAVSAALLGGLITAAYSVIGGYHENVYSEVSALSFCLICVFSAAVALSYGLICRKRLDTRSAEVKITLNDGSVLRVRLLCDSGNLVTEPFSALPVIVLSSACLPPPYDNPDSELFPLPIRAIPFSTSSGRGCFLGFRPKSAVLLLPARKPKPIEAYVGIDTVRESYSGYDGLIPASLL